jgi:serine/threonine protein kinase
MRAMRKKASERIGQWVRKKWRLEKLLGVGGMASVFAATHRNGARAALKILHSEFAREAAVKERFLREGYVANKVDHPGRVAILDDDETDLGEPFLVMELLEGETLQQLWKRHKRKVPPLEALRVAEAVLDTLIGFHDMKIIHRDIKPANIFITNESVVKLLDFGVAQLREAGGEALTRAGTALGTPSYMSPEQAMGKSDQLDGRSDIFSIGATLYAVLSGKRLHHGKSDNEAFIMAATQPASSLARRAPKMPIELIALVDRALQWDRRKRFPDAQSMRDACRELMNKLDDSGQPSFTEAPEQRITVTPTLQATPSALETSIDASPSSHSSESSVSSTHQPPSFELTPRSQEVTQQSQHTTVGVGRTAPPPTPIRQPPASQAPGRSMPSMPSAPATESSARRRSYMPSASQPPPAKSGVVRPSSEDEKLVDIFVRFEKAMPTLRHYGLDHPEGRARVRAIHRTIVEALREDPDNVKWEVHPFCFTRGPITLWEPGAPLDRVTYNLAATGVEEVHIKPGVSEDEIAGFLHAVLLDSHAEGEEGDIGAELWEAGFENILCRVRDDLADADARAQLKFFNETDGVEQDLRDELAEVVEMMATTARPMLEAHDAAEAAALALATDKGSFLSAKKSAAALALDPAARTAIGAQMVLDTEEWQERFYDVAADAYLDAASRQEEKVLLEPLTRHATGLAVSQQWSELFDTFDTLVDRIAMKDSPYAAGSALAITQAMFNWEVTKAAFEAPQATATDNETSVLIVGRLKAVLPRLGGGFLHQILALANELPAGELYDLALTYVEDYVATDVAGISKTLDTLRPELAQHMLERVVATGKPEAIEALKPMLLSRNAALRCEATALLAQSPEQLGKQLLRLLDSTDPKLREAALITMDRHAVRVAGPGLVQVVETEGFADRPPVDQRHIFKTLYTLHPARAERLLISILDQHGMLADDRLDRVRTIAAEVLADHGDTIEPIEVLENATRRRPWNTQALRSAASHAVDMIRQRLTAAQATGDAAP